MSGDSDAGLNCDITEGANAQGATVENYHNLDRKVFEKLSQKIKVGKCASRHTVLASRSFANDRVEIPFFDNFLGGPKSIISE